MSFYLGAAIGTAGGVLLPRLIAKRASARRVATRSSSVSCANPPSPEVIPVLTEKEYLRNMRSKRVEDPGYFALYSSFAGGIVTDPALMNIPLDDHMVHRGHGVFDTATLVNGMLYGLDTHLDRFLHSAKCARIHHDFTKERLMQIIEQTCSASGKRDASVRYWMTTGPGDFSFVPYGCTEPCFYVMVFGGLPMDDEDLDKGISEVTVKGVPMKPPLLATMKSNNYLLNCLTAMEATDRGGRFGILVDTDGTIGESCVMNVAFVNAEGVFITPLFRNILSGTTVRKAMELAEALVKTGELKGIEQRDVYESEARDAKEMILFAGDSHITPVTEWDGQKVGTGESGPVFKALNALLDEHIRVSSTATQRPVRYVH